MLLVGLQRAVFFLVHDLKIYKGVHRGTRVYDVFGCRFYVCQGGR